MAHPRYSIACIAACNPKTGLWAGWFWLPVVSASPHAVGTEDHAYPVGLGLKEFFEGFEGNPFRYEFHTEHGAHNWEFWDKWIQAFLDAALKDRGEQHVAH